MFRDGTLIDPAVLTTPLTLTSGRHEGYGFGWVRLYCHDGESARTLVYPLWWVTGYRDARM